MKYLILALTVIFAPGVWAAQCPLPNGSNFDSAKASAYFFGKKTWTQTQNGSSLLSSSLKDGIVKINLNFANLNKSTFTVKYMDPKTGQIKTDSAPKSAITVQDCKLKFNITYKAPGEAKATVYPVSLSRSGSDSNPRIGVWIGGIIGKGLDFAPSGSVREQTATIPDDYLPPEVLQYPGTTAS